MNTLFFAAALSFSFLRKLHIRKFLSQLTHQNIGGLDIYHVDLTPCKQHSMGFLICLHNFRSY